MTEDSHMMKGLSKKYAIPEVYQCLIEEKEVKTEMLKKNDNYAFTLAYKTIIQETLSNIKFRGSIFKDLDFPGKMYLDPFIKFLE